MTEDELKEIVYKTDPEAEEDTGYWLMKIDGLQVQVICAPDFDRMRIIISICPVENLLASDFHRLLQANFDSALDARYAVAKGMLWSVYVHPLSPLDKEQFNSALSQTVSAAKTYGTGYSSGLFTFTGDSHSLMEEEYVEELKRNDMLN
jgi:hypothetical protein